MKREIDLSRRDERESYVKAIKDRGIKNDRQDQGKL